MLQNLYTDDEVTKGFSFHLAEQWKPYRLPLQTCCVRPGNWDPAVAAELVASMAKWLRQRQNSAESFKLLRRQGLLLSSSAFGLELVDSQLL